MKLQIAPVLAQTSHDLFASFVSALKTTETADTLVRAGFAYATLGGVQTLISHVDNIASWEHAKKQFLIGIHLAITEPSALEVLRNIPHSDLRIFIPGAKLGLAALDAKPVFHPKVLAVSTRHNRNVRLLQAGSANMTLSATGNKPTNHEFSLAIQATNAASIDQDGRFESWWSSLWLKSRIADKHLILKYADLRRQVLDRNPILRFATEAPSSIGEADQFFIEVGAGSGPPEFRHQVEFPESLARFFGAIQRSRRDITLRRGEETWSGRPLSYKKTTYNVEIWRLGMPTQHMGGDPIADRAIRFSRTSSGTFEFQVADVGSKEFSEWVRVANIQGHLGATHGERARQYGFY